MDGQRSHPGRILVGRAVTALFLPHRPDFHDLVQETGEAEERGSRGGQNSWVINTLEPRDVMVVDMFGKIEGGPFVGDNLTTSVRNRTGTGAVIEGTIRDFRGIAEMPEINIFCRGLHPSFIMDVTLGGINLPMRIENVTVLPGDVVLGTPTGVVFIPAHLAQEVVETAETIMQRDTFSRARLTAGVYTPGEIDVPEWTPNIEADFQQWRTKRIKD
ncbi:MAG: RraA family protein [Thermomicrobia bacterium]|nr:RraA family protein [Thermomicrobia bacterium]